MDNNLRESFLALIRLGIGHSMTDTVTRPNWTVLQAYATRQGLAAVLLDGIEKLPEELRPPKELLLQWIGQVMQDEQKYAIQWKTSCKLAEILSQESIKFYILKGVVISECYPKPNHRVSVDLDCYLINVSQNEVAWEDGNQIIERTKFQVKRDYYKNSTWSLPGLSVENHRWLTPFRGNKRLTELEGLLQQLLRADLGLSVFEGTNLYKPPVMVSALFLIEHAYSHFLHEGLTWRHVLDWMMFNRKHQDEINWTLLNQWVDEFGFRRFYDSYNRLGRMLIGEIGEGDLVKADRLMLNDVWGKLDLHETVDGVKGKMALVGNTWRARWKYREFTDMTWLYALWIQVKGFLFIKDPKR